MGQLFAYCLQASIVLLALYLIYRWFLANEKQARFNRRILLLMYVISFTTFPLLTLMPQQEMQPVATAMISDLTLVGTDTATAPLFSPWRIVLWVYLLGMAVVALATLINVIRLCSIVLRGRWLHVDDCTLVLIHKKGIAPFSWLHFIVMHEEDYERAGKMIIAHEEQHIHCHHGADLLLAQVVIILCWFNPAAWLMRRELQTVHEYEADQCVLDEGVNARDYQMLLLKMAVGARFPSLANSLNHSIIKKRITMMNNQSTDARRRMRVLAFAPALVLAVLATNIPCVASTLSATTATTLVSDNGSKGTNNPPTDQIVGEDALAVAEKMPEFPGGSKGLMQYLNDNIHYPESAKKQGIQGRAICQFVVEKDGSITEAHVIRSAGDASLDEEALRVIHTMPKWTPGEQDGKPVRVQYAIPFVFQLPADTPPADTDKVQTSTVTIDGYHVNVSGVDNKHVVYKLNGKVVKSLPDIKSGNISTMIVTKGDTSVVEITTKDGQTAE